MTDPEIDDQDVDPRFRLANERTLLAWMRTSLGLLAGAIAVSSPVSRLSETARAGLGLWLVAVGALTATIGWRRWRAVDRALGEGSPLPSSGSVSVVGAALVATAALVTVAIVAETLF